MPHTTVNLAGEHHHPQIKTLLNDQATPQTWFSVLDIGDFSVILPGYDRSTVAFLYALAAECELRAQELEALLAPDLLAPEAAEIVSPS